MSLFSRWLGKREPAAPEFIPVTRVDQEYAYLRSQTCTCGGAWMPVGQSVGDMPGAPAHLKLDVLEVACSECRTPGVFRFQVDTSHPDYMEEMMEMEKELLGEG
jgi:hypothetical protein